VLYWEPFSPTMMPHSSLLRFALGVSLALSPLPASAQTGYTLRASVEALPDAPSALTSNALPDPKPRGIVAKPYQTGPMVNGRPYHFPTPGEQAVALRHELIGARPLVHAAIRSGIQQGRGTPAGWGEDFPGYLQRFGSAYGEAAIDNTVRFGMGLALHEDDRYLVCHRCSAWDKIKNAALSQVTARKGADGHRVASPTPFVAALSGPLVAYSAWYPPGQGTPQMALKHSVFGVVTRFGFATAREFLFDRGKD